MENYDLLVLGTGPAGLSAAIYAGRYNLKTLVIGKEVGGTVNSAGEIENYPGFVGNGLDLMKRFHDQANMFGAEFEIGEVDKLEKVEGGFKAVVGDKEYFGKAVISALGSKHRKLGISGEVEFLGKGVSYCATCDGNFFRKKKVAVVGGANSAAKAVIYLASICEKVYVLYRGEKLRCEPIHLKKIEEMENVEIVYGVNPVEIFGSMKVEGVKLDNGTDVSVDGVFVEVGATPIIDVFSEVGAELENGYVVVDKEGRTSVEGFFAAGDGTNNPFKQAITAAADGALAAKAAYDWLMKKS